MTEKEYDDASNALIEWFKSQDIKPSDGAIIMLKLIATQLVSKDTDIKNLNEHVKYITTLLSLEIVEELRRGNHV